MKYIMFDKTTTEVKVAILINENVVTQSNVSQFNKYYMSYFEDRGLHRKDFIVVGVPYEGKKKVTKAFGMEFLEETLPKLVKLGVTHIYCCDSKYYKFLIKVSKTTYEIGYVKQCDLPDYPYLHIAFGINYNSINHDPENAEKIIMSNFTLAQSLQGKLAKLGNDVIHTYEKLHDLASIKSKLDWLLTLDTVSVDIETYGLKYWEAGLATIAFCWSKHDGCTIQVDFGRDYKATKIRELLKDWFIKAKEIKKVYHGGSYDVKILVYELFMKTNIDYEGMFYGLDVMFENYQDSKLITYLCLNGCGSKSARYGLKLLAHEYLGDYGENVKDINKLSLEQLMLYNFKDGLGTLYVYEKYYPIMVAEEQEEYYYKYMLPWQKSLLAMEIVGMPVSMTRLDEVEELLNAKLEEANHRLHSIDIIQNYCKFLWKQKAYALTTGRQSKAKNPEKCKVSSEEDGKNWFIKEYGSEGINCNSGPQLVTLFYGSEDYEGLGFEPIDYTDTGNPSVKSKHLKRLANTVQKDDPRFTIIDTIVEIKDCMKTIGTFIKAIREYSFQKDDGNYYLHGSLNMGGTLTMRPSSSNP